MCKNNNTYYTMDLNLNRQIQGRKLYKPVYKSSPYRSSILLRFILRKLFVSMTMGDVEMVKHKSGCHVFTRLKRCKSDHEQ